MIRLTRAGLLDHLAEAVLLLHPPSPTLVAIDGRSAAGKTTLADDLAQQMHHRGRAIYRSSLDHFHPPGHKYRSAARRYTPTTYLAEGYAYPTLCESVLDPCQPGGSRRVRLAFWDSFTDTSMPAPWMIVPPDAVIIVDGVFLLQPLLRPFWQYRIWLDIDWPTMLDRAAARDSTWVGSPDVVLDRYRSFWIPLHELYERTMTPQQYASITIDNRDVDYPVIVSSQAE